MVENLGRKLTLILSLLVVAVISYLIGGFRLGLDLQGGTRLVYSLNLQAALEAEQITQEEYDNPEELLWPQIRDILEKRLDPDGVRQPVIRREGTDRFVIELPGSAARVRKSISLPLSGDLGAGELQKVELGGDESTWEEFPKNGGLIEIEGERIRYSKRIGGVLIGPFDRQYGGEGVVPARHPAGVSIELVALDPWRERIENIGSMFFFIEATTSDLAGSGSDVQKELEAAQQWSRENPDTSIAEYNSLLAGRPEPVARLRFFPEARGVAGIDKTREDRLAALIQEENPRWRFTGSEVQSVSNALDQFMAPAVGFVMKPEVQVAFGRFTEEHELMQMAIVINDEIATFPRIESMLPGSGQITGNFTQQEVDDLVQVLRSGSLPLRPKFESQETVGATLGADYVQKGLWSIGLGLSTVLLFMLFYYRRLGVFAALSLVFNLLLLGGALSFLQATLTLPGVAGIILTLGMAVDANILIYERIREETLRGRKPLQSAKDGFANALSTIIDANLTTLITGLILYKFGTGPVRGFATTLCIGIVTSMFSALVVTRVLVHLQLERGIERFAMARWVADTKIRFMSMAKGAMAVSSFVILAGLGLFFSLEDESKFGIDFLGGMNMTVRLEQATDVEEVRSRVGSIEGRIGESAEVQPITASATEGGFTRFRITAKGTRLGLGSEDPESGVSHAGDAGSAAPDGAQGPGDEPGSATGQGDVLNEFRRKVEGSLQDLLQKGPIDELVVGGLAASGFIYFARAHPEADIAQALAEVDVEGATVTEEVGPKGLHRYRFEGTVSEARSAPVLETALLDKFESTEDSQGYAMVLASPVEEVNAVGAQVVSELRDRAIFAMLLSLFAAVMYIRVRFAEYSFGFAAVAALTHDVLITLGALAVADRFIPFIDTEINLPMIAAFLTIIGYSLNDTIVVFDRVRENLPRMKGSLSEIIDRSINQCLSRTLLTSLTTLITVLLLLAFNLGTGNVLEGFAFALLVGVLVGTYSSMFIAAPMLLWLESRRHSGPREDSPKKAAEPTGASAGAA